MEICKEIWGGEDYVPEVWDDWLRQRDGMLVVATIRRTPVAVAHAHLQTPDVAWLEGVRVHKQYRGIGIAGKLNGYLARWATAKGARVARLCTSSSNIASRKHLRKVGFEILQTFQRLDSERALGKRPPGPIQQRREAGILWDWLSSRPEFVENRGMYSDGWTWHPLTRAIFRAHIARGRVFTTNQDGKPSSCIIFFDEDRKLTMGFAAGTSREIVRAASLLRSFLSRKKHRKVRVILPLKSPSIKALERSGFEKTGRTLVYQRFLR